MEHGSNRERKIMQKGVLAVMKEKRFKTWIKVLLFLLFMTAAVAAAVRIGRRKFENYVEEQKRNRIQEVIGQDFYPVFEVMKKSGYQESAPYVFQKEVSGKRIEVVFDFTEKVCRKNLYEFSLHNGFWIEQENYYVRRDILESILNCTLKFVDGIVVSRPIEFETHAWTRYPSLIAHAGGSVREKKYNAHYTNSLEAIVTNYNLGHRVFEVDFYLTSDEKLAAVHDWEKFGNQDGTPLSSEQWKQLGAVSSPETEGRYTAVFVEDILDEMLVNRDLFLVTDTKSFEFTEEETKKQFQIIVEEAKKRDVELLDRIIPQIYHEEMYDLLLSIYEFPSMIYTVYATETPADQVISFAGGKDQIKVITAPAKDKRFDEAAIASLHGAGLLFYTHTIQTYDKLTKGRAKGVDGFYTGLLLPRDMETYNHIEEKQEF